MRALLCLALVGCTAPDCFDLPAAPEPIAAVWLDASTAPAYMAPEQASAAVESAAAAWGIPVAQGGAVVYFGDLDTDSGALAVAIGSDAIVLSTAVHWSTNDCDGWEFDLESVLLHEMGHLQGLHHTKTGIMAASLDRCEVRHACN